ncbi:MAG: tetratricopeptide repeat protein [Rhodanobacteraceae bacterium]
MTEFLARLKQRKIVQWAIAYIAFAFALIQVIDVVADSYDWPHLVMHLVFGVLVLGFVVVLLLAWYHGERGAQHMSGAELLLIALALAIGGGLLWHFGRAGSSATPTKVAAVRNPDGAQRHSGNIIPDSAAGAASSGLPGKSSLDAAQRNPGPIFAEPIPAKSIAVLPFVNESGNSDQQYFSDGLSEDLITTLSQLAGLEVISRDSSFQFRKSKQSSAQIGKRLGVAHLLEGSVQRAGDEVRVTATLVDAANGHVQWSQRYDKPYKDLFALQDAITKAVAEALQTKLLATPGAVVQSDRPGSGNLAAYNDFLQGRFYDARQTETDQQKAIGFYESAIHRDPRYALAWAAEGYTWSNLAGNFLGGREADQAWAKARATVHTALKLNPDLAAAHADNAFILASADHDQAGALVEAQRAYQLAPNKNFGGLANRLATLGQVRRAVDLIRQGLPTDPLCAGCYGSLAFFLRALGRMDESVQAWRKELELQPENYFDRMELVYTEAMRGDATAALKEARQQPPGFWRRIPLAFALQIGADHAAADAALRTVVDKDASTGAYQIAELYALRRDPDNMFEWLEHARANHDPGVNELLYDPAILRYRNDPRFAAFCKKVGLPTTTDAVALR